VKRARVESTCWPVRIPLTTDATAGLRSGNWTAAAGSSTPCRAQMPASARARAISSGAAGA
jgi:hypothetical protein